MRKILVPLLLASIVTLLPMVSAAEVIIDDYAFGAGTASTTWAISVTHPSSTSSYSAFGQGFRSYFDGANVTNLQVRMYQVNAGGTLTAKIQGSSGLFGSSAVPNGTVYATSDGVIVAGGAYATINFTFPDGYIFDSSQDYFVTVEGTSGDVASVYLDVDATGISTHVGNGASFNLGVWTASASDMVFILYGSDGDAVSFSYNGDTYITEITEVTNVTAEVTTGEVNVGGVTATFNNTAVSAGDVSASGNVTVTGDINVSGGGTSTNDIYTWIIFLLICLNVGVGLLSRGYILPATVGMVTISVATAALFTADYAKIIFSPWLQLILLLVGIMGLWGAYHNSKVNG